MKSLTIRQPWASLVAAGVKTVETRPWATKHRGPIAIHAALSMRLFWQVWDTGHRYAYGDEAKIVQALSPFELDMALGDECLPTGAIVATANLVDCVPIVAEGQLRNVPGNGPVIAIANPDLHGVLATWLSWIGNAVSPGRYIDKERSEWLKTQTPFGDFSPRRYAWILDDIAPTTERCPACCGEDGAICFRCMGLRRCDPIPAKGKQGLWTWDERGRR